MNKNNVQARASQSSAFKYSLIASAVIGLSSASTHAAEENVIDKEELEVIQVTGTRANAIQARDIKLNAETVVDVLSAKDMGSLADRSVLEAIARLPGVALERFAGANDPDHFGVEGGGVVVRGLTFTKTNFNGRDSFSADSGRGLSFQDVSPELMGSVEVFKNQTADMIEGGIAGTVNLNTRKAFDSDGRVFSIGGDLTYTDMREETSPTFSVLYSDIWETDIGRFGFLINGTSAEVQVESDNVTVGKYYPVYGDDMLNVPETGRFGRKQDDLQRTGFDTSLQWESTDRTLLVTGEFMRSKSETSWAENTFVWAGDGNNDRPNLAPIADSEFLFDDDGYFEGGVIISDKGWGENSIEHEQATRIRDQEGITDDYSLNVKFTPNDSWAMQFDIQYVDSTLEILDFQVATATRAIVGMDLTGDFGKLAILGKDFDGTTDYQPGTPFQDPGNSYYRHAMDHISDNEGTELATRFDVQYTFDEGILESVEVGARYANREQTTRQTNYKWGNLSNTWSNQEIDGETVPLPPVYMDVANIPYEAVEFDNFARGGVLGIEGGNTMLFPTAAALRDYANAGTTFNVKEGQDWKPLADASGNGTPFKPNHINVTEEISTAAYVKFNFEGDLAGLDYSANLGLRYVKLENNTDGFISFPDNTVDDPTDPNERKNFLPQDDKDFGNAYSEELTASNEYTNVLPSFNFKLNLTDELLVRFAFSEAIALPKLGYLRNYVGMSENEFFVEREDPTNENSPILNTTVDYYKASSGNPYLKPIESYNYDLSFEYYHGDANSVSFAIFHKEIDGYFQEGESLRDYTNNGVTKSVQVNGPINLGEGTITGWELGFNQFFDFLPEGWNGLGMSANYTYVDEDGSPNSGLKADEPNSDASSDIAFDNVPLEGLSKTSYNVAGFYEKYGISARIAYSWREEYLLTASEVNLRLPIWNEPGGQIDASVFYQIDDNWQVGLQGVNLNDNTTVTKMQVNNDQLLKTRAWHKNDRRYSFVVRATF
jgi:TonB-dependent receptor